MGLRVHGSGWACHVRGWGVDRGRGHAQGSQAGARSLLLRAPGPAPKRLEGLRGVRRGVLVQRARPIVRAEGPSCGTHPPGTGRSAVLRGNGGASGVGVERPAGGSCEWQWPHGRRGGHSGWHAVQLRVQQ